LNILQDIKIAFKLTGEVRKARKNGAGGVELRTVKTMPVMKPAPAFLNTMEGCTVWQCDQDTRRAVEAVFNGLPYETRRQLEYTPEAPGEWVERARFWQRELRPVLPPKMYHTVMMKFVCWYAHCLPRRITAPRKDESICP